MTLGCRIILIISFILADMVVCSFERISPFLFISLTYARAGSLLLQSLASCGERELLLAVVRGLLFL